MKLIKEATLLALFVFCSQFSLAQQDNVKITTKEKKSKTIYIFPVVSFNEEQIRSHINRINTITESTVEYRYKNGQLELLVDPVKVSDYNLDNLLRGATVLSGYVGYELNQ